MKKSKVLSVFLTACLLVSLVPAMSRDTHAAGEESHVSHDGWTALTNEYFSTNGTTISADGKYYLTENITDTNITIESGTVWLCLNGYVLDADSETGDGKTSAIAVMMGATLNLCDCDSSRTHYFEDSNGDGCWEWQPGAASGTYAVTGGVITGGKGYANEALHEDFGFPYGGGVVNCGTLNMYSGTVAGNSAHCGGGIGCFDIVDDAFTSYVTFNLYGGTIEGNMSTFSGGAIANYGGTAVMSGGTCRNNVTSAYGGALSNTGTFTGVFTMTGGTFENNTSGSMGGAIYNEGTVNLGGGTLSSNTSAYGGGIANCGTLNMTGGTLSNNRAEEESSYGGYGGGVYNVGVFNMSDGTIANNNTAEILGGGVVNESNDARFNLSGTAAVAGEIVVIDGAANTISLSDELEYGVQIPNQPEDVNGDPISITNWNQYMTFISESEFFANGGELDPAVVRFDADGGSPEPAERVIAKGSKADEPTEPTKAGYTFDGWYVNGVEWNFATDAVTVEEITFTAQWLSVSAPGESLDTYQGTVYARCKSTGDAPDVISVDVVWGSMQFAYNEAGFEMWDSESHTYAGSAEIKWTAVDGGNLITVTNHSNVDIEVGTAAAITKNTVTDMEFTVAGTNISYAGDYVLQRGQVGAYENADYVMIAVMPVGTMSEGDTELSKIADITISIAKYTAP